MSGQALRAASFATTFLWLSAIQSLHSDEKPVWYSATSQHYVVESDVSEAFCVGVTEQMEQLYGAYGRLLALSPPENDHRFRIEIKADVNGYIERQQSEYHNRKFNNPKVIPTFVYHHYGMHSKRNVVCGFRCPDYALKEHLRHEGLHQYLRSIINDPPQWLNEGLAELVEGYQWDAEANALRPFINRGFLRRFREGILDVDQGVLNEKYHYVPIRQIIAASKADWLKTQEISYAESWAICYFLAHGPHDAYRPLLPSAIKVLQPNATRQQNTALILDRVFQDMDWDLFEERLLAYYRELKPPGFESLVQGQALMAQKKFAEAEAEFAKALSADPDHAPAFYFCGSARYAQSKFPEAEQDLLGAVERFPEYSSALFVLGKVHVYTRNREQAGKYLRLAKRYGTPARHVDPWLKRIENPN